MKFVSLLFFFQTVLFGCASMQQSEKQETAELHMEIAIAYIQKDNLPLALKELLIAEDIDPKNPPPGIDLVLHKPLARDQLRRAIADLELE